MNATDLMVGDLVRVNRDGLCIKKDTVVRVMGIDGESKLEEKGLFGYAVCRPLDRGQLDGGIWLDYLKPIPLTPEILEKNGFTLCVRDGGYYLYADESYSNQTMVILLFHVDSEYNSNHVHELQHALRLCGIEKEIVL